jgi:hypothetical protein
MIDLPWTCISLRRLNRSIRPKYNLPVKFIFQLIVFRNEDLRDFVLIPGETYELPSFKRNMGLSWLLSIVELSLLGLFRALVVEATQLIVVFASIRVHLSIEYLYLYEA